MIYLLHHLDSAIPASSPHGRPQPWLGFRARWSPRTPVSLAGLSGHLPPCASASWSPASLVRGSSSRCDSTSPPRVSGCSSPTTSATGRWRRPASGTTFAADLSCYELRCAKKYVSESLVSLLLSDFSYGRDGRHQATATRREPSSATPATHELQARHAFKTSTPSASTPQLHPAPARVGCHRRSAAGP